MFWFRNDLNFRFTKWIQSFVELEYPLRICIILVFIILFENTHRCDTFELKNVSIILTQGFAWGYKTWNWLLSINFIFILFILQQKCMFANCVSTGKYFLSNDLITENTVWIIPIILSWLNLKYCKHKIEIRTEKSISSFKTTRQGSQIEFMLQLCTFIFGEIHQSLLCDRSEKKNNIFLWDTLYSIHTDSAWYHKHKLISSLFSFIIFVISCTKFYMSISI